MKAFKLLTALSLCLVIAISGCGKKEEVKKDEKTTDKKEEVKKVEEKKANEFKTKTGKTFQIIVNKNGESTANIFVVGTGFENTKDTLKFKDSDPFEQALLADLDGDGFEELYIFTRAAGSGSYLNILGVASNKDKSFTQINVQKIEEADMKAGKNFEGYMGHDKITAEKDALVLEFPVYKEKDAKDKPTGGKRKVFYKLSSGEAAFQLKVVKKEDIK